MPDTTPTSLGRRDSIGPGQAAVAELFSLDRMDDEQARQLLTQRVGAERLGSDSAAIDRIVRSRW